MNNDEFPRPHSSPRSGGPRRDLRGDPAALAEIDSGDLQVLDRLRDTIEMVDPIPPGLSERLTFQVSLALMNAEVAEIQREPAQVRAGVDMAESVTFSSGSTTLMVMVSREDDGIHIDGWVSGAAIEVELVQRELRRVAISDVNGRLSFPNVSDGPTQFVIRPGTNGGRPVVTPPMEL